MIGGRGNAVTDPIWIDVDFDHGRVRDVADRCRRLAVDIREAAWSRVMASGPLLDLFEGGHATEFIGIHAAAVRHHHALADRLLSVAGSLDRASDRASVWQEERQEARILWERAQQAAEITGAQS